MYNFSSDKQKKINQLNELCWKFPETPGLTRVEPGFIRTRMRRQFCLTQNINLRLFFPVVTPTNLLKLSNWGELCTRLKNDISCYTIDT